MDLDKKRVARLATREAMKIEADRRTSEQSVTKSRLLSAVGGFLIAFTVMVAFGSLLGTSEEVAIVGFICSWISLPIVVAYILGKAHERRYVLNTIKSI
jgi:hypothetical protein